jgi:hypothetical protein
VLVRKDSREEPRFSLAATGYLIGRSVAGMDGSGQGVSAKVVPNSRARHPEDSGSGSDQFAALYASRVCCAIRPRADTAWPFSFAQARRLTLTWFVGCGVMIVATYGGTAALFGGLAVAAVGGVIVLAISTVAMASVHGDTSGGSNGSSVGWAFAVSLSSLTLAGLTAAAWLQAGRSFGPMPLWWAAGGLAFVLCAAAASRRTAIPAGLVVFGLVVVAVVSFLPAGTFTRDRMCPNEAGEESAAYCVP